MPVGRILDSAQNTAQQAAAQGPTAPDSSVALRTDRRPPLCAPRDRFAALRTHTAVCDVCTAALKRSRECIEAFHALCPRGKSTMLAGLSPRARGPVEMADRFLAVRDTAVSA